MSQKDNLNNNSNKSVKKVENNIREIKKDGKTLIIYKHPVFKKGFTTSFLYSIIIFVLFIGIAKLKINDLKFFSGQIFWICILSIATFRIFFSGKISRWRSIIFVILAWSFIIEFKSYLFGLRGSAFFSEKIQEIPYCHIAISTTILNFFYKQYLAFSSGGYLNWAGLSIGFLWFVITFAIGQGWCSWVCFYGGIDDGFSRILRKPILKWINLPKKIRDLPVGILIFFILISFTTLLPEFCMWLCPLKLTTAFLDVDSTIRLIQFYILIFGAVFLLFIIPLITKKRSFCGLICPFSAWQSFFGKINPFRVSIDKNSCTQCGYCQKVCPTFAIYDLKVIDYCNRCGMCIDACPTNAIDYTVLGKNPAKITMKKIFDTNTLFIFSGIFMSGVIGLIFVPKAAVRIINLFIFLISKLG